MKFCINCANFVLQDKLEHRPDLGLCTRVEKARNPVTGDFEEGLRWQYAQIVRKAPTASECGLEGRFFVSKEGDKDVGF